jgi:hypothetical protein
MDIVSISVTLSQLLLTGPAFPVANIQISIAAVRCIKQKLLFRSSSVTNLNSMTHAAANYTAALNASLIFPSISSARSGFSMNSSLTASLPCPSLLSS